MRFKKIALGALVVVALVGTAGWLGLDKETRGLLKTLPTNRDLLFWSQPQRDAAFRALDRLSFLAKWRVVAASDTPSPLPPGPPLNLPAADKMCAPGYLDIQTDDIPEIEPAPGVLARVIAGTSHGVQGKIQREATRPLYLDIHFDAAGTFH